MLIFFSFHFIHFSHEHKRSLTKTKNLFIRDSNRGKDAFRNIGRWWIFILTTLEKRVWKTKNMCVCVCVCCCYPLLLLLLRLQNKRWLKCHTHTQQQQRMRNKTKKKRKNIVHVSCQINSLRCRKFCRVHYIPFWWSGSVNKQQK